MHEDKQPEERIADAQHSTAKDTGCQENVISVSTGMAQPQASPEAPSGISPSQ
jgi:hypothetical protein